MMQSKLYLLLAILFVFVICSISVEQKLRKGDSALDSRKSVVVHDKDAYQQHSRYENDDDDADVDDNHSSLSSYADNRYAALDRGDGNYRTRARWPSQPPPSPPIFSLDDFLSGNDWPRFESPNTYSPSLPPISYDNNPMMNNGPTCSSLVDQQYPIFSDTCGAVPQARYALPNAFGHRERWQVAQILTAVVGSSTDPACTRSLRLLLCPILFPPCPTRHEPPAVLPCQSYCRAVKARCSIPTLDLLPCEVLPHSSDLCPTNQAYGSFIPPGAVPPLPASQPPTVNSGFPPSNYPGSRSFPSFQSLLSPQGIQSAFLQSPFSPASSPSALASMQSASPVNLYNGGPYPTESLNPMYADYPSRSYTNDYRQAMRYGPFTRSSTETRPSSEVRPPNVAHPSLVKA